MSTLNVNLEQVALRVKDELLREGNKTWILPDDAAEIEKLKKPKSTWVPWTVIQKGTK